MRALILGDVEVALPARGGARGGQRGGRDGGEHDVGGEEVASRMTLEPTDGPMTTSGSILDRLRPPGTFTAHPATMPAATPVAIANAQLDPIVAEQARFRIEGSGPLASRQIVPASKGASQLVTANAAVTDAVRGVLRLVEHAAGGPEATTGLQLSGVALSDSVQGHGGNSYQAHMEDDTIFQHALAGLGRDEQVRQVQTLGRNELADAASNTANVVAGWINVGPAASGAMLARAGTVFPGFNDRIDQQALGNAVRVLRHEAQHAADPTSPKLDKDGAMGLREAIAEAHSTSIGQLRDARRVLGLDAVVDDAALLGALSMRPYANLETVLRGALLQSGIATDSPQAAALLARPSDQVAEELVADVSRRQGLSVDQARSYLSTEFGQQLGRHA